MILFSRGYTAALRADEVPVKWFLELVDRFKKGCFTGSFAFAAEAAVFRFATEEEPNPKLVLAYAELGLTSLGFVILVCGLNLDLFWLVLLVALWLLYAAVLGRFKLGFVTEL